MTFVEVVHRRACERGSESALTFLAGGGAAETGSSYAELDRRARGIAATLQRSRCLRERAVILCPPGPGFIEAFLGCLYAGVIAVPVTVPRPNRPLTLLQGIIADCQPRFAIASECAVAP